MQLLRTRPANGSLSATPSARHEATVSLMTMASTAAPGPAPRPEVHGSGAPLPEAPPLASEMRADTGTDPPSSVSPRTPSPILGAPMGDDTYTPQGGHLTFPQVGLGLGTMEQEMQMLMDLENVDELDETSPADAEAAATELTELVAQLGLQAPASDAPLRVPSTDDTAAREEAWAQLTYQLAQRLQQQTESRERMRHLLRVTRLASLSLFSSLRISYSHMLQAERDIKARLEVELSGSKTQSKMLSDMISRASLQTQEERTPRVAPATPGSATADEDDERTKLLADKRYLRQRVRDTEAQVARLETELRSLRPLLLRANHADDETLDAPTHTPRRTPRRARGARREAVMGDATSEHLILATRMLRTLRQAARPPSDAPARSGPDSPQTPRRPVDPFPTTPKHTRRANDGLNGSPYMPSSVRSMPASTYSSGLDDLLHAAQSLAPSSPPHSPWTPHAPSLGSPKRRRMSSMDMDDAPPTSALDVLANQAAIEHTASPMGLHRRTHSGPHILPGSTSWTPGPPLRAPASASKVRAAGSGASPEKRLPYVRWSAEEDAKLRRAIHEHGQRWEHVARAVGTRSYHQCRQRYLLMRRKEAAANGTASPSRAPRTPQRGAADKEATLRPSDRGEESSGGASSEMEAPHSQGPPPAAHARPASEAPAAPAWAPTPGPVPGPLSWTPQRPVLHS